MTAANPCVERMGTSRSGRLQFLRQRRLVPTAHARRSVLMSALLDRISEGGAWKVVQTFEVRTTNRFGNAIMRNRAGRPASYRLPAPA
jgi:hypothetical protein